MRPQSHDFAPASTTTAGFSFGRGHKPPTCRFEECLLRKDAAAADKLIACKNCSELYHNACSAVQGDWGTEEEEVDGGRDGICCRECRALGRADEGEVEGAVGEHENPLAGGGGSSQQQPVV